MAYGDGGLHDVRAGRLAEPLDAQQRREAPADQELVPAPAPSPRLAASEAFPRGVVHLTYQPASS